MDPDFLLIMIMIVLVTGISGLTINGVVKKVLDYKRDKNAVLSGATTDTAQMTQISERTDHIEDRLKVLERIATDPDARRGADLAQEIEQLRIEQGADTALQDAQLATATRQEELG